MSAFVTFASVRVWPNVSLMTVPLALSTVWPSKDEKVRERVHRELDAVSPGAEKLLVEVADRRVAIDVGEYEGFAVRNMDGLLPGA